MAIYNPLPTVATGDPWSAANANEYWRDNFAAHQAVIAAIYPIGSIYITTVATNPASVLGFGTWIVFGAGRTLVGDGASDASYAAGGTGGESTHTLTPTEIPAHVHVVDDASNPSARWSNGSGDYGRKWTDTTNKNSGSVGSSGAHNNMPPYVVVYFWKRTA